VNNVLPGYTRTERLVELAEHLASTGNADSLEEVFGTWEEEIPAGRLADPSELGALVAFLASERAGYITGTSIAVDGGWTRGLLPALECRTDCRARQPGRLVAQIGCRSSLATASAAVRSTFPAGVVGRSARKRTSRGRL
jgi:hypothetical protein